MSALFYLSDPDKGHYFLAKEALHFATFEGPDRFKEAEEWAASQGGQGPFVCAGTFEDTLPDSSPTLTVWQPKSWEQKPLTETPLQKEGPFAFPSSVLAKSVEPQGGYTQAVATALSYIQEGYLQKIVLARFREYDLRSPLHPWQLAAHISREAPEAQTVLWQFPGHSTYVAASPERLVCASEGKFFADSLASTAPRGKTLEEDTALAQALLERAQLTGEQSLVTDYIVQAFRACGLMPSISRPSVKKLSRLQHVYTLIQAQGSTSLLKLVAALHPTPAVAGLPKEAVLPIIRKIEGFDRSYYAGLFGWFNLQREGHFAVALRGAILNGQKARVFAGSGIVPLSNPEAEAQETHLKLESTSLLFRLRDHVV